MIPVLDLPMYFLLPMSNLSNIYILHHMHRLDSIVHNNCVFGIT